MSMFADEYYEWIPPPILNYTDSQLQDKLGPRIKFPELLPPIRLQSSSSHDTVFSCAVLLDGILIGFGAAKNARHSKKRAAFNAIHFSGVFNDRYGDGVKEENYIKDKAPGSSGTTVPGEKRIDWLYGKIWEGLKTKTLNDGFWRARIDMRPFDLSLVAKRPVVVVKEDNNKSGNHESTIFIGDSSIADFTETLTTALEASYQGSKLPPQYTQSTKFIPWYTYLSENLLGNSHHTRRQLLSLTRLTNPQIGQTMLHELKQHLNTILHNKLRYVEIYPSFSPTQANPSFKVHCALVIFKEVLIGIGASVESFEDAVLQAVYNAVAFSGVFDPKSRFHRYDFDDSEEAANFVPDLYSCLTSLIQLIENGNDIKSSDTIDREMEQFLQLRGDVLKEEDFQNSQWNGFKTLHELMIKNNTKKYTACPYVRQVERIQDMTPNLQGLQRLASLILDPEFIRNKDTNEGFLPEGNCADFIKLYFKDKPGQFQRVQFGVLIDPFRDQETGKVFYCSFLTVYQVLVSLGVSTVSQEAADEEASRLVLDNCKGITYLDKAIERELKEREKAFNRNKVDLVQNEIAEIEIMGSRFLKTMFLNALRRDLDKDWIDTFII